MRESILECRASTSVAEREVKPARLRRDMPHLEQGFSEIGHDTDALNNG